MVPLRIHTQIGNCVDHTKNIQSNIDTVAQRKLSTIKYMSQKGYIFKELQKNNSKMIEE